MNRFRKVLAGLKLATVSAVFWGTALLLGRIGLGWITHGIGLPDSLRALFWSFLPGAVIGFIGG
ncbi:MAG: hypothetical protein KC489_13710, partial [Gemmatimonadetes bacterium]|nr:hypothetical protein [Gemmatimonadota bacterium]